MPDDLSLRDLARIAGVAPSTASHALNGTGRVATETRTRIRALAAAHGYRPRADLASLSARRRGAERSPLPLAVIDPGADPPPTLDALAAGYGYRTLAYRSGTPASVAADLDRRGVRAALILGAQRPTMTPWIEHDWVGSAVVCLGCATDRVRYHTVRGEVVPGVYRCWEELRARGLRRIGAVMLRHRPSVIHDVERHAACLAMQRLHASDGPAVPICDADLDDRATIARWYRQHRPEAILGVFASVREALPPEGRQRPFACLHCIRGQAAHRDLAGIEIDADEHLRLALDLLDGALRRREFGPPVTPHLVSIRLPWRPGRSLGDRS